MDARKRRQPASRDRRTIAMTAPSSFAVSEERVLRRVMAACARTRIVAAIYAEGHLRIPEKSKTAPARTAKTCSFFLQGRSTSRDLRRVGRDSVV
jgi:hypothetical protein